MQCNQIIRIFTSKSLSNLIEEWAKSTEVIASVFTKLFGLVRDRSNLWMTINNFNSNVSYGKKKLKCFLLLL